MNNENNSNDQSDGIEKKGKMIVAKGGVLISEYAFGYYNIDLNNFFKEDDKGGFMYKNEFISFFQSLKRGQLVGWKKIFELMDAEIYVKVNFLQKPRGEGRTSMMCSYEEDGIEYKIDLMLTENLYRLVWQYSMSLLNCHVSLEELYDIALSASNKTN